MEAPAGALSGRRVLLGVTGGIAAYKAAHLTRLLVEAGANVQVVMTPAATRFVGTATFAALSRNRVHTDVFEQEEDVLHVRLARDSDVCVIAPATANILAKLALGLADDLLTSVVLEARCPLVVAPAMHSGMWRHPATRANVAALEDRSAIFVGPDEGPLAAGDEGVGRMAGPETVLAAVVSLLTRSRDLAGIRVLVTAGPTHEPIDAARYLANRSSGKMGFAVAAEAAARGGEVTLVAGPVALSDPPGVAAVRVETAADMREEVLRRFDEVDAVVMAAAVADFRPSKVASGKLKKESGLPAIDLEPTPDILKELSKARQRQVLVGFAAETDELEPAARRKLIDKDLDFVVANEVGRAGTGFGADTNMAAILARGEHDEPVRAWLKTDLAREICDRIAVAVRGRSPSVDASSSARI